MSGFLPPGCHWHWWVFHCFMHPSVQLSVTLSIHPSVCQSILNEGLTHLLILGRFHVLLAWNLMEWCTVPWGRLQHKIPVVGQFLYVPKNFEIFHDRHGSGLMDDVTVLTIYGFQVSALNLVQWCKIPWSRLLLKMPLLSQFLPVPQNFEIFYLSPMFTGQGCCRSLKLLV